MVVRDRRRETENGERKNDMLAALLDDEGGGGGFSDEEIVDFMLALLVAGYETTSTIMTLAVKFLTETPLALAQLKVIHSSIPSLFFIYIINFVKKIIYFDCVDS